MKYQRTSRGKRLSGGVFLCSGGGNNSFTSDFFIRKCSQYVKEMSDSKSVKDFYIWNYLRAFLIEKTPTVKHQTPQRTFRRGFSAYRLFMIRCLRSCRFCIWALIHGDSPPLFKPQIHIFRSTVSRFTMTLSTTFEMNVLISGMLVWAMHFCKEPDSCYSSVPLWRWRVPFFELRIWIL